MEGGQLSNETAHDGPANGDAAFWRIFRSPLTHVPESNKTRWNIFPSGRQSVNPQPEFFNVAVREVPAAKSRLAMYVLVKPIDSALIEGPEYVGSVAAANSDNGLEVQFEPNRCRNFWQRQTEPV